MLSTEDNERLTKVGPGTAMGSVMREYWIPALLSAELPQTDGNPMRVRLVGENLIAFRDSAGRVGLLADNCSHRGASLFYGRNEEKGLRCVYHGWKYDVEGHCVDMPSEPPASNFKDKIRHPAYPCIERGGVIWSYMGPRDVPPPLPDLEWNMIPDAQRSIIRITLRHCNWLQALEGDIDACHTSFLHSRWGPDDDPLGYLRQATVVGGQRSFFESDHAPRSEAVDTPYGVMYGSCRSVDENTDQWRIYQFLMPFHTFIGGGGSGSVWVPVDDEHTMCWSFQYDLGNAVRDKEQTTAPSLAVRQAAVNTTLLENPQFIHGGYLPSTTDWLGRWRLAADESNDFLIDRERQRTRSFTGIPFSNVIDDAAVTTSMGYILDRTKEHLGTSDTGIAAVRRRLIECVKAFVQNDVTPPGVDDSSVYYIRSGAVEVPKGTRDWLRASETLLQVTREPL